jgi:hypothetical protein
MNLIDEKKNENQIDKRTKKDIDQNIDEAIDIELLKKRGYNPHRLVDSVVKEDQYDRK